MTDSNAPKRYSLVDYYAESSFNPVPIGVEDADVWEAHIARRNNLYQYHLGVPMGLLRDREVLEFGCNSGENALVFAAAGAKLTLVEPNTQVWPRLEELFSRFGYQGAIESLSADRIEDFEGARHFDVVLAEGFLSTLPDRAEMVGRIARLLRPGGVGVISFNTLTGGVVELTKRLVLWRACRLAGVDPLGEESLAMAGELFGEEYSGLPGTRPFHVWWKDTLVNSFLLGPHLWDFPDVAEAIVAGGASVLSTSPRWSSVDDHRWYKLAPTRAERQAALVADWRRQFAYFLTGTASECVDDAQAGEQVLDDVRGFVAAASAFASADAADPDTCDVGLDASLAFLGESSSASVRAFADDLGAVLSTVRAGDLDALLATYAASSTLRVSWGVPYQYVSFVRD